MELIPSGTVHVQLPATGDHFTWQKPSTWMRNMIAGNRYLEHCGEVRLTNQSTGEYALISFKEATGGLFTASANRNEIVAILYSRDRQKLRTISGRWSDRLLEETGKDKYEVIWRPDEPPADQERYYGFTNFATELNEITEIERDRLPKTDTRHRPDQRMFEEGNVVDAEAEKVRVEQRQRDNRKQLEATGKTWNAMWFELRPDPYAAEGAVAEAGVDTQESWQYKGGYWEARESGVWPEKMAELW
ncbi:Oxysterol-binding protein [Jimgerdemannia flammicorona]|uniref:Oxysterol-binding protein n=1 Tax=Jimgerdemannia flammicorona TaxID=994334 RepID=A0A433Q3V7_9FUNG|nr:Oxysterol-binding protein [Jimgerdemannia flammicorona]